MRFITYWTSINQNEFFTWYRDYTCIIYIYIHYIMYNNIYNIYMLYIIACFNKSIYTSFKYFKVFVNGLADMISSLQIK
jgi:hypothetical protein